MIDFILLTTLVATIVLGVTAQVIAERMQIPSIIFLLTFGVAAGPDGLNVVRPYLLREGLYAITALSIAIILFEGGLTLQLRNVQGVSRPVINLITVGALVTWAGGALVSKLVLDISWTVAILFGSLVIVTGPTVIGPLLRTVKVSKELRTILKWEGILIDPVGAIIAVLVLGFVVSEEATLAATLSGFIGRIVVGAVVGAGGGFVMGRLMRLRVSESVSTLLIFAGVFLVYGISEAVMGESGIMSVTVTGLVMGNMRVPNINNVKGFKEKITLLMVSVLFILLAAHLRLDEITMLGWRGIAVVLGLMFVVRPLNVWASVREKGLSFKAKLFLSWVAPRGIIAAAVASLFSITLERHGFEHAQLLSSLTFLTIAITVFVQGLTASPLAKFLGLLQTGTSGVFMLGGSALTIGVARELKAAGISVAILDSNNRSVAAAEREGVQAFHGDVLDDQLWDDIDLTPFGSFLAATSNNELNSLACARASQVFEKDRIYQIRNSYRSERQSFTLDMIGGNQHYDLSLDITGVSTDLRNGSKRIDAVGPAELDTNATKETILLGMSKQQVLFSTDIRDLASAEKVVRVTV